MGKTGKWIKSFWAGKKDQKGSNITNTNNNQTADHRNPTTPVTIPRPTTPKEKRRWSFRRSSASAAPAKDPSPAETTSATGAAATATATTTADATAIVPPPTQEQELGHEKLALPVANATTAEDANDITVANNNGKHIAIEEAAAIMIQSVFRSYLARKALKALRGLVKLQALVRGHLVRKQATATLRCMQALVTAQARARAQRITNHRHSTHRRNSQDKLMHPYHDMEENIKIVEMDHGEFRSNSKSRNMYSVSSHEQQQEEEQSDDRMDNRMSTYYSSQGPYSNQEYRQHISPAPSAITEMSPRTYSGHFEDYSFPTATAQSSPQCYSAMSKPNPSRTPFSFPKPDFAETMSYDYPLYPNYMSNTESSRAKARSQSAPKQRPELERQPSRGRRASVEGRGIPRGARMQRSSSHVGSGSAAQNYQYPWSIKLDKSTVSLIDSECGSTCSVFTNAIYARSVVSSKNHFSLIHLLS